MDEHAKAKELAKLFLCFPSEKSRSLEDCKMMTAAYLEILQRHSVATVAEACLELRKRATPFPPSSGEIFQKCEAISASKFAGRLVECKGAEVRDFISYSDAQRQKMKDRFDRLISQISGGDDAA